jgi:pimeloyl-ACP methyl ester carboxylesterase
LHRSWDDQFVVPYAKVNGVSLYYERAGSGERELLFVPGWCCDHTACEPQFDYFSDSYAVTALDLRGVGKSDGPRRGPGGACTPSPPARPNPCVAA